MAGVDELLCGGLVEGEALGLEEGAFVPVEADPAHAFEDALDHFVGGALEVGVLDAEDEGSTEWRAKSQLKSAVRAPPTWR